MRVELEIDDEHVENVWKLAKMLAAQPVGHSRNLGSALLAKLPAPPCGAELHCSAEDLEVADGFEYGYECKMSVGHHGDHQWHSPNRPELVIRWPESEVAR